MNRLTRWTLLLAMATAAPCVWAMFPTVRIVAPQLLGLACPDPDVCLDDTSRTQEARALYADALRFVDQSVGHIARPPRVVFCASTSCYHDFGLTRPAGRTSALGIVISPRGWRTYYVRHEMIHHLQIERLGVIGQHSRPEWFTEGMAYALSQDPREQLMQQSQQDRARFESWYRGLGSRDLWVAARAL